jgi:uncharacterized protein involved in type VI secretion and phage assembly
MTGEDGGPGAQGDSEGRRYYGKYRGVVVNNIDPMQMGRITVMVPDVSNVNLSTWAMPCLPVGGIQMGMFAVPPIGAGVWVEFERGDSRYPIWTGCFYGSAADVPALSRMTAPPVDAITFQTTLQNGITISDMPGPTGGIVIKSTTGATLIVNDTGIYIQNGKGASIVMTGPTVTINQGALMIV